MKYKKLILILLIVIYLISTFGAWHAIRWYHIHEWTHSNPTICDIIIVITPAVNTVTCLYWLFEQIPEININKFFDIEKR